MVQHRQNQTTSKFSFLLHVVLLNSISLSSDNLKSEEEYKTKITSTPFQSMSLQNCKDF